MSFRKHGPSEKHHVDVGYDSRPWNVFVTGKISKTENIVNTFTNNEAYLASYNPFSTIVWKRMIHEYISCVFFFCVYVESRLGTGKHFFATRKHAESIDKLTNRNTTEL